jgi:molybdopterin converting factor subunit 1
MLTILTFGIAKDIAGGDRLEWACELPISVAELKSQLQARYPSLAALRFFQIAVNEAYATDDLLIQSGDEVAIIPPVSGG